MIVEQLGAELIMRIVPILHFLTGFISYMIPTLCGSIVNLYVLIIIEKKKNRSFGDVIVYAIIPAVILTAVEGVLIDFFNKHGLDSRSFMIMIAFGLGLIDDEITLALSSLTNIVRSYNFIIKFINAVKRGEEIDLHEIELFEEMENIPPVKEDDASNNEESKKPDKDTT